MNYKTIELFPKYLWFLILSYSMIISISNWFDARLVEIFHFVISPGAVIFPLTFLVSDIITEVYGYKYARLAIWSAFIFNILFVLFGQLIIHLPSPSFAQDNAAFNKILSIDNYVIVASFLSYLISEPVNSYIIAKLKIKFKGKFIGIRFVLSTIAASGIDSVIFITIAFSRTYSLNHIFSLIFSIWLIKIVIEILGLPLSIRLANLLKQKEQLDIYDSDTNFSPFSIDVTYDVKNNKFNQ